MTYDKPAQASPSVICIIVAEAFKRYAFRKDKNLPLLSEYAKTFHVDEKVGNYLEVLI